MVFKFCVKHLFVNVPGRYGQVSTGLIVLLLATGLSRANPVLLDFRYGVTVITHDLPDGVRDIEYATDGMIYGVTNKISGPSADPEDELFFSVDPATGAVTHIAKLSFTNPVSADLYRITQGPGGVWTDKMYVTDWVSGSFDCGARLDRFNTDFTGYDVVIARCDLFSTTTSDVVFAPAGNFGVHAFFASQAGGVPPVKIFRFPPVNGNSATNWGAISGVNDIRALAFSENPAFGSAMYVAGSSVLNGFDDAPGQIQQVTADASGDFQSAVPFISEASGLLEFGTDMVFDTIGLFDHLLIYRQADGLLKLVTPGGTTSDLLQITAGGGAGLDLGGAFR